MADPNLSRLKSQLLTSGLQQKNNALYQVINQLIITMEKTTIDLTNEISAASGGSGGGTTPTTPTTPSGIITTQNAPLSLDMMPDIYESIIPLQMEPQVGTWTPVIGGSGGTTGQVYSAQNGYYLKMGRFVSLHCLVQLSTLGTITGNVEIQGLPFVAANLTNYRSSCAVNWALFNTALVVVQGFILPNTSVVGIFGMTGAVATVTQLTQTDLLNNSAMGFSVTYLTQY